MSSLWTPDGERPVSRGQSAPSAPSAPEPDEHPGDEAGLDREQLDALQRELADAPAAVVIANHCFGFFELAALHLSVQPPNLEQASLAIDALGCLVDGLEGRFEPAGAEVEPQLREALAQLRMAYVQIKAAQG